MFLLVSCKESKIPDKGPDEVYFVTINRTDFLVAEFADSMVYDENSKTYFLYTNGRMLPSEIAPGKDKIKIDVVHK